MAQTFQFQCVLPSLNRKFALKVIEFILKIYVKKVKNGFLPNVLKMHFNNFRPNKNIYSNQIYMV